MYLKVFIIIVLTFANICESYNILLVFPFPFKSHGILGEAFANVLLEAGHNVSYITATPVQNPHSNLRQILIKRYHFTAVGINFVTQGRKSLSLRNILDDMLNVSYSAVSDPNVQELMEDTEQTFDLVVAEWMLNELFSGFSAVFDCPYIWFFTLQNDHEILRLIGETPNPSIISNIRTNNMPPHSFLERMQELWFLLTYRPWRHFVYDRFESKAYEELFSLAVVKRGRTLPTFEEVRYNASFFFINSHLTLRDSLVTPQCLKAIGGYHISEKPVPLTQELLNILESSVNGVILFSLGTFLKVEDMPSDVKMDLLAMFSQLNYTILWKINEQFEDLPANVRTFAWIPLQSVLAHPKCILFISHGGILSLSESVHYGVPVVGIPVFGDQILNVKTAVRNRVAKMVSIGPRLVYDLEKAVHDILSDPRYKENMMALSSLYHDRPLSPRAELLHWVEHTAATRGAVYLRSSAVLAPWYQACYLDLAAVLLLLLIGLFLIVNKLYAVIKRIVKFDKKDSRKKRKLT